MTAASRSSRSKSVRQKEPSRASSPIAITWPDELAALPDEAERQMLNDVIRVLFVGDSWLSGGGAELQKSLVCYAANLWQDLAPQDAIEQHLVLNVIRIEIVTRTTAFRAIPSGGSDLSAGIRDFVRLTGTSAKLLEQLDRRRRGVQQKVVVEHVHVEAGGQAIVGAVDLNARNTRKGRV